LVVTAVAAYSALAAGRMAAVVLVRALTGFSSEQTTFRRRRGQPVGEK